MYVMRLVMRLIFLENIFLHQKVRVPLEVFVGLVDFIRSTSTTVGGLVGPDMTSPNETSFKEGLFLSTFHFLLCFVVFISHSQK